MTGAGAANVVEEVKLVRHETRCRKCARSIRRGQRAALVFGVGQVHLRCLLDQADETAQAADESAPDQTSDGEEAE